MKGATSSFLLGLWLGGSLLLFGVVGYNFAGVKPSFEANPELAERAGFDPEDDNAKKTSVIWVYASELNRAFFFYWNRIQLGLGVLTLLVVLFSAPRWLAIAGVASSLAIVCVLTFHFAPQLVELGRSLDFVSRDPTPPPALSDFQRTHGIYSGLELAKCVLLLLAFFAARAAKPKAYLARSSG